MAQTHTKYLLISAVILSVSFIIYGFNSANNPNEEKATVFLKDAFNETEKSFAELDAISEMYLNGTAGIEPLQKALSKARLSYKKIEFFLEFHYPEYVKSHINGAPVLHLEQEGMQTNVLEPEGLQALDELVFSKEATNEKSAIFGLARRVHTQFLMMNHRLQQKKDPDYMEIESLRLEIVRIMSLGITGFDTPGSLQGLKEAQASLTGMKEYFELLYSTNGDESVKQIVEYFDGSVKYLSNNTDFKTFDRLEFIRSYLDPLYKTLGKIDSKKQADILGYTAAWNPGSSSVFAADFLNPYAFTNLNQKEDSEETKKLGKKLFYDPAISNSGTMSCASCHQPEKGFSDGLRKSESNISGKTVLRNAPTLLNAVYADRYFYDLRAFDLEQQAEHVIFNSAEFNTAYSSILKKIENSKEYKKLFEQQFGKNAVTRENFAKALASYVLSLQSFNSEFDRYIRGETTVIDKSVKNGFNLFMGKANCATCHFAPTFSGLVPPLYNENESEILGVLQAPNQKKNILDDDKGRIANNIYAEKSWIYEKSFKTTTVRNVALTAPYFHNGAYQTLEEVVDFYDHGGGAGLGVAVPNQTLGEDALNLTDQEKNNLASFLKSLTDNSVSKK